MIGERAVFLNLIIAGGKNYVQGVFLTVQLMPCWSAENSSLISTMVTV